MAKVKSMLDMEGKMRPEGQEHFIRGVVKWYSPLRRYGFITDLDTGADVRLDADELWDFGWDTIAEGAHVEVWAISTKRGLRVYEICKVLVPSDIDERRIFDTHALDYISSDYVPARVDWFDEKKGYGFASTYGDEEACFLHYKALAEVGLKSLNPGDVISIRIGRNNRGRIAACVRPVDAQSLPANDSADTSTLVAA